MTSQTLQTATRIGGDRKWVVVCSGPLDTRAENHLTDIHGRACREGVVGLALDLGGVTRLDGGGLALLLRFAHWTRNHQQTATAFGLAGPARQAYLGLGLGTALPLFAGEQEALGGHPGAAEDVEAAARGPGPSADEWCTEFGPAVGNDLPPDATTLNVAGHGVRGPMDGFGQLWNKQYRLRLAGVAESPEQIIATCKAHLGDLWPEGNVLTLPPGGIGPCAVGHIHLTLPGGAPLSTGIRVLHAGARSFTFLTLSGHLEAGWITFCAFEEDGAPVMQVESMARTGDPLYELGFLLFGHRQQQQFWRATLTNLADRYRVPANVTVQAHRLETDRRWDRFGNLMGNAAVRTGLAVLGAGLGRLLRGRGADPEPPS